MSQPSKRSASIPAPGKLDSSLGEFWVGNPWDIINEGHNLSAFERSRTFLNLRGDAYPPDVMARMRTFVTGSQLHRNLGGLKFEQKGKAWQVNDCGWAYGAALIDLDNDGWLDLYATAGFMSRDRNKPDG